MTTMYKPTAEQIHELVGKKLRGIAEGWYKFKSNEDIRPTLLVYTIDEEGLRFDPSIISVEHMMASDDGKRAIVRAGKDVLARGLANLAVFYSEAWVLDCTKDDSDAEIKAVIEAVKEGHRPNIKDHPQRVEAVVLNCYFNDAPDMLICYKIDRDKDGNKVIAEEPMQIGGGYQPNSYSGVLTSAPESYGDAL